MAYQGNGKTRSKMRPRTILLILILVFILPFLIAFMMYKGHNVIGRLGNHGELIEPPFSVSLLKLKNEGSELFTRQSSHTKKNQTHHFGTKGKWTLVYFNPGLCEAACQKGLYNLRQIRAATGKNKERIERVLLTYKTSPANNVSINLILSERFPGTKHLTTNESHFTDVIRKHVHESYALEPGTVYIIDPHGNVMMSFQPGADRDGIFKDLQRLLKVSQIG